jgi:hypothetical protein
VDWVLSKLESTTVGSKSARKLKKTRSHSVSLTPQYAQSPQAPHSWPRATPERSPIEQLFPDFDVEARLSPEDLESLVKRYLSKCRHGRLDDLRALMSHSQIDVDRTTDAQGNSGLIVACQNGQLEVAKLFIEEYRMSRESINRRNAAGNTALHYCYSFGHERLADYLMEHGADCSIRNSEGKPCSEGLRTRVRLSMPHIEVPSGFGEDSNDEDLPLQSSDDLEVGSNLLDRRKKGKRLVLEPSHAGLQICVEEPKTPAKTAHVQ